MGKPKNGPLFESNQFGKTDYGCFDGWFMPTYSGSVEQAFLNPKFYFDWVRVSPFLLYVLQIHKMGDLKHEPMIESICAG